MVSTLKQIISKHEFIPKQKDYPTQTKENRDIPPIITIAPEMYEHKPKKISFIDVVIENKFDGNEHSAVYIRPSHQDILHILRNTKAKNKESKEKYIDVLELKEKFCNAMPQYYDHYIFEGLIFWFAYPRILYDQLKTVARTI